MFLWISVHSALISTKASSTFCLLIFRLIKLWGLACKWIPNFQPLADDRLSTCHHKQILQSAPVEWNDITFHPSTDPMLFCYIFHCCSHVWDTNLLYWKKLNYKLIIMNKWKQSAKNWLHPTFTNVMIIHQIIPTFKSVIPQNKKNHQPFLNLAFSLIK